MGTSSSSLKELQDNEYLQMFSGKNPISPNDPFWNQLLSFTYIPSHNCADGRLLEDSTRPMLNTLLKNNAETGNITALINVFLRHASELKASVVCENKVFVWQTYNSLFILRSVLKYFIETSGEESLLKLLSKEEGGKGSPSDKIEPEKLLELFINALFEIIVDVSLENTTYAIIVEAVNMLLVLLSVQMFSTRSAQLSVVFRTIMQGKCSIHSLLLVKTLLIHYMNQEMCPHCLNTTHEGSGFISGIASSLWNILSLSYIRGAPMSNSPCRAVLANQCLLLLLALVNHCTNEKEMKNPYRDALFSFRNISEPSSDTPVDTIPAFKLDYNQLYATLCATLKDDQTTLLVYLLIHKNSTFKQFLISTLEVESLIVPILKILYDAPEKSSHHIYMALIVLLILSEDESFGKRIHSVKLKSISWYTERTLSDMTLGGLIMLILIRTIQYNMTRMHDKYLHTNCLAALANMSANFQNLHPYVCQKFIGLIETMAKKQSRLADKLKNGQNLPSPNDDDLLPSDLTQDMSALIEVIRMLLEILNSCLTSQLKNNVNLLYTMLYNRHVFTLCHSQSGFEDILQNIDQVVAFFSEHLQTVDQSPSVVEVSAIINEAALLWPKDKLKKFPDMKFKYVEEGQPEEFFVPYLWSLVFHASDIYWDSRNILMFSPRRAI